MLKRIFSEVMLTLLVISMLTFTFNIQPVKSEPKTWIVDDDGPADFHTIQEAINAASDGDTIVVYAGTYIENVNVNKRLTIKSQSGAENTIVRTVDPMTQNNVFEVTADNVTISGFTATVVVGWGGKGIHLNRVKYCVISDNICHNNSAGIYLSYSHYNVIINNNASNNQDGIYLHESHGNKIINNIASKNTYGRGISLAFSSDNEILNNIANSNQDEGIVLMERPTSNNVIANNTVNSNRNYGIHLFAADNNRILNNIVFKNGVKGIWLRGASKNNEIAGNKVRDSSTGIYLGDPSNLLGDCNGNVICLNNLINNYRNAYSYESISVWNSKEKITYTYKGNPFTNYLGNYWSDYTGVDLFSGPYQNETGSDGIGDTPYVIDENNTDRYPLMNPWGSGTPYADFIWSPSVPEVNELITFNASASMPIGGEIISYEWDFGDGNYASGKIVTHRYSTAGTFTVTLNVTDSEGLWDIEQKQIKVKAPPPLTVSISPTSTSILVGESVTFTSTVSGGYTPYAYQWYLNGNPVSEATADTWTFTPTESGIFYVYLKVTDDKGNTAQSETARITVAAVPVGGYSYPKQLPTTAKPITPYITLLTILTAIFITIKRKTKRKH